MKKYIPAEIESRWQKRWKDAKIYNASEPESTKKAKYYVLDMFPYPSGDGLHVGHFKGYTATDVISRYLRAKGFNVLHPMGWDAFGLPAENYAIKTGINPKISTAKNISHIKSQMEMVGLSYDWDREINTTVPNYYRWTQWIFLQLYKKGLAYEAEAPINWCPKDKTGLANEEVVNGLCERCGSRVVRKKIRQWILAITKYADRLLNDLEILDWPQSIKEMQKNWIGRSEGIEIDFPIAGAEVDLSSSRVFKRKRPAVDSVDLGYARSSSSSSENFSHGQASPRLKITVFTKFPETIFGVTYMVLAPEHEMVSQVTGEHQHKEVEGYVKKAAEKTDLERTDLAKVKTGVFTGSYCINPVNGEKVPIWVADYVLAGYGTGAVMGVPGSDERDFEFAKKFNLPIVRVIGKKKDDKSEIKSADEVLEGGFIVNSGQFDGMKTPERAKEKFMEWIEKNGWGKRKVAYKLRDWIFSRQRYWGEPIPIIHCEKCGIVPVSEEDLPVLLPEVEKYQPTGTGESPLAAIDKWVNVKCPNCGGDAKRETNTMPQWAGSCWYYLRFIDPKNSKELISPQAEKYWMGKGEVNPVGGVDWYVGGAEHAVLHLLYARFWHKFLFDIGVVSREEPFFKLRNVGLIMGPDGQKMSKSRGNVISPEEMVKTYGADTLRLFEMFIGPFGDVADWDPRAVEGVYRFMQRIWLFSHQIIEAGRSESDEEMVRNAHRLTSKVEGDIGEMKFNTAVAFMMEFVNELSRNLDKTGIDVLGKFLIVLSPFAPHITEEIWQDLGRKDFICSQPWPKFDPKLARANMITLVIQINGRVRDKLLVEAGIDKEKAEKLALGSEKVTKFLGSKSPQKVIFIPDRLVNFVA